MNPVERLEALLVRVQKNAAVLAEARARGEWQAGTKADGLNGHAEASPDAGLASASAEAASVTPEVASPEPAARPASVRPEPPRPMLALEPIEEEPAAPPEPVRGESGELLAVDSPNLGEAELEAELAASETSGGWQEPPAPSERSRPAWSIPAPANDAAAPVEPSAEASPSWEPPAERAEAVSGSWAHEQAPAPDWQEATPAPAPTWQADAESSEAAPEDEERAPRTPPPESGPQVTPPGKLGVPELDAEGPISVAGEQIAVEQLGGTVELEPATSGTLEMLAPEDAPGVAPDEYEEPLPRPETGAVYDESLAPPPNVTDELAAMDRARAEKATRLSAVPEVAMTVASDTIAVPPPAAELETGVLARSPVPAGIVAATFEGQRRAAAHTFLELLDDSLGLGNS